MMRERSISIHAPREGGDARAWFSGQPEELFQSTPPARGATYSMHVNAKGFGISIHAPREGGDITGKTQALLQSNFNPRPPRGGRHSDMLLWI